MAVQMTALEILQALVTASEGHDLTVGPQADLSGAYVSGPLVQAYVFPQSSGFEVDLWAGNASDAYEVVQGIPDLTTAVNYAIENVLRTRAHRTSKTVRSWATRESEAR